MSENKPLTAKQDIKWTLAKVGDLKTNPNNPRVIKDDKFKKLVESIRKFPKMMEIRPIVVNSDMVVLGGNMRLKACKELGLKEVPIIMASDLTEDQQREFIIKDNVGFGEWDWELLAKDWDAVELGEWGLDLPKDSENPYTSKIQSPIYEAKNEKPPLSDLVDEVKKTELIGKINAANIPEDEKRFLIEAAHRHSIFHYQRIADYYAHSPKEVQELMEDSALVIIDFGKAIENGFVRVANDVAELFNGQYPNDDQ